MGRPDYSHRDLASSTAGILQAYVKMSRDDYRDIDEDTAVAIAEAFIEAHEEHDAETPTPDLD